jgi:hypothetical protein
MIGRPASGNALHWIFSALNPEARFWLRALRKVNGPVVSDQAVWEPRHALPMSPRLRMSGKGMLAEVKNRHKDSLAATHRLFTGCDLSVMR